MLKGKVAIITGASTGIGKAIALRLAQCGVDLVLCARNEQRLLDTASAAAKFGVKTLILKGDLTDDKYLFSVADKAAEEFGRVDILINNAGMAYNAKFDDTPTDVFDNIMRLNVRCTYFMFLSVL